MSILYITAKHPGEERHIPLVQVIELAPWMPFVLTACAMAVIVLLGFGLAAVALVVGVCSILLALAYMFMLISCVLALLL